MKYLGVDAIEDLNQQLQCIDNGDLRIFTRIELYSCKSTTAERKLKHHIDHKYESEMVSLSPNSPNAPYNLTTSKKTLFLLVSTLNAVYPDYDFSDVKPQCFSRVPGAGLVVNQVNNTILLNFGAESKQIGDTIWDTIDSAITVKECDIYEYTPATGMEPDAEEGNFWSFYYFFYHKVEKRMLFFTSRAVSFMAPLQPEESGSVVFADEHIGESLGYADYTMQMEL